MEGTEREICSKHIEACMKFSKDKSKIYLKYLMLDKTKLIILNSE